MSKSRRGFTLVELLMVIAVIGILTSLVAVGGMYVITSSREAATKSTLQIAKVVIGDRIAAFSAAMEEHAHGDYGAVVYGRMRKEVDSQTDMSIQSRLAAVRDAIINRIESVAGSHTDPMFNNRLAKVMLKMELMRLFFPQTWAEADYMLALNGQAQIATNPASPTENSEVLLWLLTEKAVVGFVTVDDDSIAPSMRRDLDGNGRFELVDSWGNPIRFYRWPTRLLRPEGMPTGYIPRTVKDSMGTILATGNIPNLDNYQIGKVLIKTLRPDFAEDPDDGMSMVSSAYTSDSDITGGNSLAKALDIEQAYHLPHTYHAPVLVSAGPDGIHGLKNPANRTDFGYWGKIEDQTAIFDDISSGSL